MQLTSTHWGTYRYKTENGKVTALTPFEDDTAPTKIGQGILDVLDHETRITQPMVRQSWLEGGPGNRQTEKRGSDRFIAIDWDTASQLVGDELQRVIDCMAIRLFMPGPMAGPVLADFIMHKVKFTDF